MKKYGVLIGLMILGMLGFSGMAQADLNDGLVAYYPFNGNPDDESGNGNDGAEYGGINYVDGRNNQGANFDGSNDYTQTTSSSSLQVADMTISAWIYWEGGTDTNQFIAAQGTNYDTTGNFQFSISSDGELVLNVNNDPYWVSGGVETVKSSNIINPSQWYYVTATFSNNTISYYIDGEFDSSGTYAIEQFRSTSEGITIGDREYGGRFFKGIMDELRIYNRALSGTEIQTLYDNSCNHPPTAVISAMPLNGYAPLTVTFNSYASYDIDDGDVLSCEWQSSDGQFSNKLADNFIFNFPGTYTITMTVKDSEGATDQASQSITVYEDELNVLILTDSSPDATVTSNQEVLIYGTNTSNRITIESGAKAELINFPGNNKITIEADSGNFTVFRSGAVLTLNGEDGTLLKFPATTNTQILIFNDTSLDCLIQDGRILLGDQVISTIPESIIEVGSSYKFAEYFPMNQGQIKIYSETYYDEDDEKFYDNYVQLYYDYDPVFNYDRENAISMMVNYNDTINFQDSGDPGSCYLYREQSGTYTVAFHEDGEMIEFHEAILIAPDSINVGDKWSTITTSLETGTITVEFEFVRAGDDIEGFKDNIVIHEKTQTPDGTYERDIWFARQTGIIKVDSEEERDGGIFGFGDMNLQAIH